MSICAATSIYGELGVLNGIKSTGYPTTIDSFKETYVNKPVVIDKNFITAAGPGVAMQFAFAAVEKLASVTIANTVAKEMLYNK